MQPETCRRGARANGFSNARRFQVPTPHHSPTPTCTTGAETAEMVGTARTQPTQVSSAPDAPMYTWARHAPDASAVHAFAPLFASPQPAPHPMTAVHTPAACSLPARWRVAGTSCATDTTNAIKNTTNAIENAPPLRRTLTFTTPTSSSTTRTPAASASSSPASSSAATCPAARSSSTTASCRSPSRRPTRWT